MSKKRWRIIEQRIARLGPVIAIMLLLVACNRVSPPLPGSSQAAATDAPTVVLPTVTPAEDAPEATPTFGAGAETPGTSGTANGGVGSGAIFTSPRYSYTVVLPCCWLALPTAGTALESAIADQDGNGDIPLWGDLAERLRERDSGALMELIALLPDDENLALPIAQVTVSVLPTYGLTLDDYVEATAAELTRIANTTVEAAYVEPSLGVEAFPAAVIEYTAAPTPVAGDDADPPIAGMQVAFFGHDADALIVLTFTTSVERFADLQPEFMHIVRTVTLHDPAI